MILNGVFTSQWILLQIIIFNISQIVPNEITNNLHFMCFCFVVKSYMYKRTQYGISTNIIDFSPFKMYHK